MAKDKVLSLSHVQQFETFNHCYPDVKIIYPAFTIENWHAIFYDRGLDLNLSIRELNELFKRWALERWAAPHLQVKLKAAFVSV